jgi:hypothetical protein
MGFDAERARSGSWVVIVPVAGMLLALILVLAFRVWRLDVPFERDEGEYAYMGQLMLQGVPPYSVAANMKLPGTYAAYALSMALFGQTVRGVHLGYLLVTIGGIVLLYFLARRLWGTIGAIAAAASYAVLSSGATVDGLWAHATHFVVLFALAGTLLLLRWSESRKLSTLLAAGLLYGMAFLMKQPGIFFAAFGACYIVSRGKREWSRIAGNLAIFGTAVLAPFAISCAILWRYGVFSKFWFWVFGYAAQYVSRQSLADGANLLFHNGLPILELNLLLCLAAAIGFCFLWMRSELRTAAAVVSIFLLFSWLAVCPGLYFRPHYFVLVLPAAALLIGAFTRAGGTVALWTVIAALALSIWTQRGYFYEMAPADVVRGVYGPAPFPEAVKVADYVKAHTANDDHIAVLGSEPEIYFYAGRRSVTPYLYIDALQGEHALVAQMHQEYIDDVEAWKPRYMVFASAEGPWGASNGRHSALLTWAQSYYEQYYDRVGVADITEDGTIYKWDADAANYRIESSQYVLVLKRK